VLLSLRLPDHDPLAHLIGAATGFLVLYLIAILYRRARAREGLGLGDAKLAAAAGAWLSWQALPSVILIACAAAFIWIGVRVALRGRAVLSQQIAFGVPLCFAFWLIWLYGAPL
jgi:leader peptidase (prepilin peptidase)/N-methyltransferase